MSIENNFKYSNVASKLNNIFKILPGMVKEYVIKSSKNIVLKKSKLSFENVLYYKFLYADLLKTKQKIVSSFNFNNDISFARTSFYYREKQIPLSFYNDLYKKISDCYKQLMNINKNEPLIFAVDGTFNNINSNKIDEPIKTCLNMCYYDIINECPIELTFEGFKSKNSELHLFKKYISKANFPKNSIIILDRAYCSYELLTFLNNNNYKFVIRFRNNCKNFDKTNKNFRILDYFDDFKNKIDIKKFIEYIKKNNKKNKGKYKLVNKNNELVDIDQYNNIKNCDIKMKYQYKLVTNLSIDKFDDLKIKNLYKNRWDIEVFFKFMKHNLKFEHLKEHRLKNLNIDDEQYRIQYMINLILIYLNKIIEKTYYFNNQKKFKTNDPKKYKKINKSNLMSGIFENFKIFFKGELTDTMLQKFCFCYAKINENKYGINKERKAKTPYLKWYVKGHSNRSLLYKLLEAYLTNNKSKLNKNHILLFNNCSFEIKYKKTDSNKIKI